MADKYDRWGSYHWSWYGKRFTYTRHVDYLKRFVKEPNTLDIGAGDGLITAKLGIHGVDASPRAVALARRHKANVDLMRGARLPYKAGQFDSALMADTLQTFKNVRLALSETRRVITKNLYISIPGKQKLVERGTYHVWRDPTKIIPIVERAGFKLVQGPILKVDRRRYYFKFEKT